MTKKKDEYNKDYQFTGLSAEEAFCSVDGTSCDGVCREKYLNNGIVSCNYAVLEKATMSKQEKIKRGLIKRRRFDEDEEE